MSNDQITLERFSAIREWDVDLLLLEELHCNARFVRWFYDVVRQRVKRVLLPALVDPVCVSRHSVNYVGDGSGESDIEATFRGDVNGAAQQVLVLIEDKIDARFTELQPERYFNRCSEISLAKGVPGVIALVAPQDYLTAAETSCFDVRISYEEIAQQLLHPVPGDNLELASRRQHRALMVQHAIARFRRAGNRTNDEKRTSFFDDYFQVAQSRHPQLQQKPPRPRSVKSHIFFYELYPRISKGVAELYLEHSLDGGYASVVFRGWGTRRDHYFPKCKAIVTDRHMIVEAPVNQQLVQVKIPGLPKLKFDRTVAEQKSGAEAGIDAVAALFAWYQKHHSDFERWVAE